MFILFPDKHHPWKVVLCCCFYRNWFSNITLINNTMFSYWIWNTCLIQIHLNYVKIILVICISSNYRDKQCVHGMKIKRNVKKYKHILLHIYFSVCSMIWHVVIYFIMNNVCHNFLRLARLMILLWCHLYYTK